MNELNNKGKLDDILVPTSGIIDLISIFFDSCRYYIGKLFKRKLEEK